MVPTDAPVKVAVQVALLPLPDREHVGAVGVTPAPLAAKVTVPVGVLAVPAEVSATVAVHVVATPVTTVAGAQDTEVVVVRAVTVTLNAAVGPLAEWLVLPP